MVDEDGLRPGLFGKGDAFCKVDDSMFAGVKVFVEGIDSGPYGIQAAKAAVIEIIGKLLGSDGAGEIQSDVRSADLRLVDLIHRV